MSSSSLTTIDGKDYILHTLDNGQMCFVPVLVAPPKRHVGFLATETKRVVVDTDIEIALSTETYNFLVEETSKDTSFHGWRAKNGFVLAARSTYVNQFSQLPVVKLWMEMNDFCGKRVVLSKLKTFAGQENIAKYANSLKEALMELNEIMSAASVTVEKEDIFVGLPPLVSTTTTTVPTGTATAAPTATATASAAPTATATAPK